MIEDSEAQKIYIMGLVSQADIGRAMAESPRLFLGQVSGRTAPWDTAEWDSYMFTDCQAPPTHTHIEYEPAVIETYITYCVCNNSMTCVPRNHVVLLHLSLFQIVVVSTTWRTRNSSVLS